MVLRINKNITKWIVLFSILIVVMNIMNLFINMDFISLALYFSLLLFIYKVNRKIIIKYMFMFVMFTYHICSVFTIENFPDYIDNLQKMSYHSGAFLPLLTSYFIGFLLLFILECNKNSKLLSENNIYNTYSKQLKFGSRILSNKTIIKYMTVVLTIITLVMIARIFGNGFYSMGGIDRFEYRAYVFSMFDQKFYTYISWFLPIPLICANNGMKKRAYFFFGIYCFYLIWVGDKFGSLFLAFYFYLLVNWATKNLDKKKINQLLIIIILVLIALMIFISFQVLYERGSVLEIYEYFDNRLKGGQSDLWWGVFTQEKWGTWKISEFARDEIPAIFSQPNSWLDYNFGIYKMMRVTAPSWVVTNYLSRGVRFAASTQASLFYYFKYTGLYLGGLAMFALYFWTVNHAITAYRKSDMIEAVCYTMLISKAIQLTTMSAIDMLGNSTTILCLIILIVKKQQEQKRKLKQYAE